MAANQVSDFELLLLLTHGAQYNTLRPTPVSFVQANWEAAEGLAALGKLPPGVSLDFMNQTIEQIAERRNLLPRPLAAATVVKHGPLTFASVEDARKILGAGGRTVFEPLSRFAYPGGIKEDYRQYYLTTGHGKIPVVGQGLIARFSDRTRTWTVHGGSARNMTPGEIDEHLERGSCPAGVCHPIAMAASATHRGPDLG